MPEKIETLRDLKRLVWLLIGMSASMVVVGILNHVLKVHAPAYELLYSLGFGALTFWLGCWGYKFNVRKNAQFTIHANKNGYVKTGGRENGTCALPEQEKMKLVTREKLLHLLEKEEIYKRHNLQLSEVVEMLHSNRAYVSHVINSMFKLSFNDLINQYRVRDAKKLLSEDIDNNLSLNEIMETSGFMSNSSFFRIFKQKTGMTPNEYKMKYRKTPKHKNPGVNDT